MTGLINSQHTTKEAKEVVAFVPLIRHGGRYICYYKNSHTSKRSDGVSMTGTLYAVQASFNLKVSRGRRSLLYSSQTVRYDD
mgnify:CR=1 FL=1